MVKRNYQVELKGKKIAKAMAKNANVSLKFSLELIREIKGKRVDKAEAFMRRIVDMTEHLPLRVYKKKVAHRRGDAKSFTKSGKYPIKVAKAWLSLLQSVKANADYAGLDADNLIITHAFASQGHRRYGYQSQGRIGGKRRLTKAAHIEVAVREAA
jgi:large subunit ribosomal protein L22